jgi:hypothetical protein
MTTTFALLLATTLAGQGGDIAQGIVDNGHKRVAVLPVVLCRYSGEQSTVGSLGPRGKSLSNALYDQLVASSRSGRYGGQYEVIPERTILRAMRSRGFGPSDLEDPMKVRQLARDTGADSLVAVSYDEVPSIFGDDRPQRQPAQVVLVSQTLDGTDGAVTHSAKLLDDLTLSKAAYQGESWELRRWNGNTLTNVGIDLPGLQAFGVGPAWEKPQYAAIRPNLVHPALNPDFPYAVSLEVDGQERYPKPLECGGKTFLLVDLNPGEDYRIILDNRSQKPVYCALFIDGACAIDRVVLEPGDLETRRHWYLPPNSGRRAINGWYTIPRDGRGQPGNSQFFDRFTIVPRGESTEHGASFERNVGMITAVFYTYGMEGIQQPDPSMTPRSLPAAAFGTGLGGRKETSLEFVKGKRGLMLAAMTFYYRSAEQVAQLIRGEASPGDDPLARFQQVSHTSDVPPSVSDPGTPAPPPMADETPRPSKNGAEEYELEP